MNETLQLHRARVAIDGEIERLYARVEELEAKEYDELADHFRGMIYGLQKARVLILSPEEESESAQMRREMFG